MITFKELGSYGRLGNQLFQIASTIGIAYRNDVGFGFPEWKYASHFNNPLPIIDMKFYNIWEEKEPYYEDIVLDRRLDWCLRGYFQSWKYFHRCSSTIKHFFTFNKKNYRGVAVHVRRGDYLNKQHIHPVLPLSYYIKAMQMFHEEHFTIFSDDIEWCKHNIKGYNVSYHTTDDDIQDFKTMCGYDKFIIANSSYSWWAAYLSGSTEVVAPDNYVIGETRDDRIPEWWHKI